MYHTSMTNIQIHDSNLQVQSGKPLSLSTYTGHSPQMTLFTGNEKLISGKLESPVKIRDLTNTTSDVKGSLSSCCVKGLIISN